MVRVLSQSRIDEVMAAIKAGMSLRAIVREAGVAKGTVARYMRIASEAGDAPKLCGCGGPAGHKGWCKWRYDRSPARQAYHAGRRVWNPRKQRVERQDLVYPFVVRDDGSEEHRLLRVVNAAVSRNFDPSLRADICQELIVAVLLGEVQEKDLAAKARTLTKLFKERRDHLPLDWKIPGTGGGLSIEDGISDEDSLWDRV